MKRKKIVISLFIISLAILVLVIFLFVKVGLLEKLPQSPLIARILRLPIPIYVVPVVKEDSTRFIGANATSESSIVVQVSFPSLEIGSKLRVAKIFVKVSDQVKKGQLLAILENVSLQEDVKRFQENLPLISSKIETAKENVEEKKKYFSTVQDLFLKGFATKIELESVRNTLVQAEVDLRNYEQQMIDTRSLLNRTSSSFNELKVLSPMDGVVLEKKVEEGDVSSVGGTPMFSIGQLSPIYVVANVSQEDKDGVYLGQEAEVSFNYLPGRAFKGKVVRIDPTVDVKTQTFEVRVSIPNENRQFVPGSAAFVRFSAKSKALVIPRLAVVGRSDEPAVFVVEDGRAYLRKVILGMAFPPNKLEVIRGLSEGERVASFNLKYLSNGSRVLTLNDEKKQ
ncbi:MAG: hypothetical protein C4291_09035 [Candidatus Dadabacteria bacterium]